MKSAPRICRGETLTATRISSGQWVACLQASKRVHLPICTMRPHCSATWTKSPGRTRPLVGEFQRKSASNAYDPSVRTGDERLVIEFELVALHRDCEVGLHRPLSDHRFLNSRVEKAVIVLTTRLGGVEGEVRLAEQFLPA